MNGVGMRERESGATVAYLIRILANSWYPIDVESNRIRMAHQQIHGRLLSSNTSVKSTEISYIQRAISHYSQYSPANPQVA